MIPARLLLLKLKICRLKDLSVKENGGRSLDSSTFNQRHIARFLAWVHQQLLALRNPWESSPFYQNISQERNIQWMFSCHNELVKWKRLMLSMIWPRFYTLRSEWMRFCQACNRTRKRSTWRQWIPICNYFSSSNSTKSHGSSMFMVLILSRAKPLRQLLCL